MAATLNGNFLRFPLTLAGLIHAGRKPGMKVTIRDLFCLMLVVAICCLWWIDHRDGGDTRQPFSG
jgi:hypothetical protein